MAFSISTYIRYLHANLTFYFSAFRLIILCILIIILFGKTFLRTIVCTHITFGRIIRLFSISIAIGHLIINIITIQISIMVIFHLK